MNYLPTKVRKVENLRDFFHRAFCEFPSWRSWRRLLAFAERFPFWKGGCKKYTIVIWVFCKPQEWKKCISVTSSNPKPLLTPPLLLALYLVEVCFSFPSSFCGCPPKPPRHQYAWFTAVLKNAVYLSCFQDKMLFGKQLYISIPPDWSKSVYNKISLSFFYMPFWPYILSACMIKAISASKLWHNESCCNQLNHIF